MMIPGVRCVPAARRHWRRLNAVEICRCRETNQNPTTNQVKMKHNNEMIQKESALK